jgi:4-hydroxy-3-methylbut-2-en-1-yl diphosphate reductase
VVKRVLLASPRGYCAGVERAIDTLEAALQRFGSPVYVRRQIVHNAHVVAYFETLGAIFVEDEDEVPEGETVVFSAHGVSPQVYDGARARGLHVIDAVCPLVTKVHAEARRFAELGYTILLIGHDGHDEVEGTLGHAPGSVLLVESLEDAHTVAPPPGRRLAWLTQTTLSVDETADIVAVLERRFPGIVRPPRDDICYATANRQRAVRALLSKVELVLVIGSANSSNSKRLVEVARAGGVRAHLIEDETTIAEPWLDGVETVGLTAGASVPERLVTRVCDWFRERGALEIVAHSTEREDVTFRLPPLVRGPGSVAAA